MEPRCVKAAPAIKAEGSRQKASSPGLAERTEGTGEGSDIPFLSVSVAWTSRISPDPPRTSGPSSPCKDNSTGGHEAACSPEKSVYEVTGSEERTQGLPHRSQVPLPLHSPSPRTVWLSCSGQSIYTAVAAQQRGTEQNASGGQEEGVLGPPRYQECQSSLLRTQLGQGNTVPFHLPCSPTRGSQSQGRKFLQARNGGPCGEAGRAASSLSQGKDAHAPHTAASCANLNSPGGVTCNVTHRSLRGALLRGV